MEENGINNELDENAQLEINNLYANDKKLEKLKSLVSKGLGSTATELSIELIVNTFKLIRYEVKFWVIGARHFDLGRVKDWLHEALLVGWDLSATFVRP
ncbi:MAG: hypothetical protein EOP36_11775 [Rubrivivax sp.]|nr:MAG: hypothetical protein EOP36_11775 [Rubrivivax sp.]